MNEIAAAASNVLIAAGVVVVAGCIARRAPIRLALGAGLDLWLGATLLRLIALQRSWSAIAVVAAVVLLRRTLVSSLGSPATR